MRIVKESISKIHSGCAVSNGYNFRSRAACFLSTRRAFRDTDARGLITFIGRFVTIPCDARQFRAGKRRRWRRPAIVAFPRDGKAQKRGNRITQRATAPICGKKKKEADVYVMANWITLRSGVKKASARNCRFSYPCDPVARGDEIRVRFLARRNETGDINAAR